MTIPPPSSPAKKEFRLQRIIVLAICALLPGCTSSHHFLHENGGTAPTATAPLGIPLTITGEVDAYQNLWLDQVTGDEPRQPNDLRIEVKKTEHDNQEESIDRSSGA